jgi:hypothetical protein
VFPVGGGELSIGRYIRGQIGYVHALSSLIPLRALAILAAVLESVDQYVVNRREPAVALRGLCLSRHESCDHFVLAGGK